MSAGAPWSVKGIDPKAREIAKDLARRSGMTLGEWLNTMIMEGDADEDVVATLPRRAPPYAGGDRRGRYRRLDDAYDAGEPNDDLSNVAEAIERLTARIEAAEARSTLAVSGVDQAVAGLLARLDANEREQSSTSARVEHLADDLRDEQTRLVDRVRQVEREAQSPRATEALRALETALGKIANQFYEGDARTRASLTESRQDLTAILRRVDRLEARTPETEIVDGVVSRVAERLEQAEARTEGAVRALETSFAALDQRLAAAESRLASEPEGRLERLADDLAQRFDESRAELIRHFDLAAEGRFDQMDKTLAELTGHVQQAEKRSAQAIEKMGHEVLRIAQNLNRRMSGVETSSSQAVERVAQAVEQRMRRSEGGQAQALEKLSTEITRISAQLTERIIHSERRAAQSSDDMGERIGRLADKIEGRYERASSELAERIRQSEERTTRLLAEARETIDRSLTKAEERAATAPPAEAAAPAWAEQAPPATAFGPLNSAASAPSAFAAEPAPAFAPPAFAAAAAPAETLYAEPAPDFPAFPSVETFDATPNGAAQAAPAPTFDDYFAAETPAANPPLGASFDDFSGDTEFLPADAAKAPPRPPVSTKEAIEAARAAARLGVRNAAGEDFSAKKPAGKNRLQDRINREAKRDGSTAKKALFAMGAASLITIAMIGGYRILAEDSVAEGKGGLTIIPHGLFGADKPASPLAAVALEPAPVRAPAADQAKAAALFQQAKDLIDNNKPGAVDLLKESANLGNVDAQFKLAELYTNGQQGLTQDLVEARRWTQRAAEGGHPSAMYNLAMLMIDGTGGQKDMPSAVKWMRKAADLNVGDAQFNLGVLYEQGLGVPKDFSESRKWYLIAARDGDADARQAADRIGESLSVSERRASREAAEAFRPENAEPVSLATR